MVVAPPGSAGTSLLLARAATPEQAAFIGNQSGGRVFLGQQADDFWREENAMGAAGSFNKLRCYYRRERRGRGGGTNFSIHQGDYNIPVPPRPAR